MDSNTNSSSTKELKRVLGRGDLMSFAISQMIGAGIMTLVGVAIAQTGRSVNIAFLIAAGLLCLMYIPNIIIGGTARLRGGRYTQVALFAGKFSAGIFVILYLAYNIMIAMYAISFAQYFNSLFPDVPQQIVAIIVLTIFYIINIFGTKGAARIQTALLFVLIAALLLYTVLGVPNIQPGYFEQPGFLTDGIGGLIGAGALLTFALAGADVIVQLGGEAKNPKKDIPFVLIVSTIIIAIIYAGLSMVAAGVLPIDQVAGQPLSVSAEVFMSNGLFTFFVIGGALIALATTLNATLGWVTKPIMQACDDGWFPRKLAKVHPKFKTPIYLLTAFYIIGLIPIILNITLDELAMATLIFYYGTIVITTITLFRAPKVMPELWAKSSYKVSNGKLKFFSVIASLSCIIQIVVLFGLISMTGKIVIIVVTLLAVIFAWIRSPKIDIQISHEED